MTHAMTCISPSSGGSLKGVARASRRTSKSSFMYSMPMGTRLKYDTCVHELLCTIWATAYVTKNNLLCSFSSQDCISLGSGEPNTSEYHSFVLYHNNSPRWSEMVKLSIPIDRFRGSHLRFEFRHCSSESVMQPSGSHPSVHEFNKTS